MKNITKLIISIVICQLAGVIGSFATASSVSSWYQSLTKPFFTPPGWLFAPVWIALYFLMGISVFLIWQKGVDKVKVKKALGVFILQLAFNAFWSIAFFGLKSPLFGLIVITLLWIFILITMIRFLRLSKWAGWLLAPYITWTSFAVILNFSIWIMNVGG